MFNQINNAQQIGMVISRILNKLHEKSVKIFSDSEEEQLQQLLALTSRSDLSTLLDAASYIFEQAAYRNCSGTVLQAALQENTLLEPQVYLVLSVRLLHIIFF